MFALDDNREPTTEPTSETRNKLYQEVFDNPISKQFLCSYFYIALSVVHFFFIQYEFWRLITFVFFRAYFVCGQEKFHVLS